MINTLKRTVFSGFIVRLLHDDVCMNYSVEVRYLKTNGVFFARDYKTKGSAIRSFNSWVSKISDVDERFSNVK